MNHDDSAEFFLTQAGGQAHTPFAVASNAVLSLGASIAHSLCSLNAKLLEVMEEEAVISRRPIRIIDYRVFGGHVTEALVECDDSYSEWIPCELAKSHGVPHVLGGMTQPAKETSQP